MLERRHQVALLHPGLDEVLVLGSGLPAVPERWPQHTDLVAAVGDPGASSPVRPGGSPTGWSRT